MHPVMGAFGQKIREAREQKGLTQGQLAAAVKPGAQADLVWRWERDGRLPQRKQDVARLIEVLELDRCEVVEAIAHDHAVMLVDALERDP